MTLTSPQPFITRDECHKATAGETQGDDEAAEQAARALYDLLLEPLETALGDAATVILSPDSQLHFISFDALLDGENKMACEKWNLRYVETGRDLLDKATTTNSGKKTALLLGDPTYNGKPKSLKEAILVADNRNQTERTLRAGMQDDLKGFVFEQLKDTAKEIDALGEKLKSSGYEPLSLRETQASEVVLAQRIKGQRIVHLATHGFFLNELNLGGGDDLMRKTGMADEAGWKTRAPVRVQNPMLRSGLALTGANPTLQAWQKGEVPDPANDGILTAAEVVNLDLSAAELIVLSACETAKGKALDGEGIYGLRRALKMAGADNVVMTLWPIADAYTVGYMEEFYDRVLKGDQPCRALAETKKKHLIQLREERGMARALNLAAPFIATGKGVSAIE